MGEGRFAVCVKGYLQGTSVCIKKNHDQASVARTISLINKEAKMLSQVSHPALCFLIGIQIQKKQFYLITSFSFSKSDYQFREKRSNFISMW